MSGNQNREGESQDGMELQRQATNNEKRSPPGEKELAIMSNIFDELGTKGHKNKLELIYMARDGVTKGKISDHEDIRSGHVNRLKDQCMLMEEDGEYKLTPYMAGLIDSMDELAEKFNSTPVDLSTDSMLFMRDTGWDKDLRRHWEVFTEATVFDQNPIAKFKTIIQTAGSIRSVRQTISLPKELHYRLHEAQDLAPENVELIYTSEPMAEILDRDDLFENAVANEASGVTYKFLTGSDPRPQFNLTLVEIDAELLQHYRGPTDWLTEFDLDDWLVVLETLPSITDTKKLLLSDAESVRTWATDPDTGTFTQYSEVATADSWENPAGPISKYLFG